MNKDIALIGYGYWGKKIYKTLTNSFPRNNIIVVDPNIKNKPDNYKFQSIKEILVDKSIKHVFIATPEETHFEITRLCLENNKNVFVEKPLCLKKTEAQTLHKIAKKNNLKIYVDYIFLYDPYVKKIKRTIEDGILGNLLHIESIRHSININKPSASVTDDLAIHDVYLGKYFFEKDSSSLKTIKESINSKQTNQASVIFYYDKKTLSAHYSWIQPTSQRVMTFFGSEATLVWDKSEKGLLIYKNQKFIKKIKVKTDFPPLEISINSFLLKSNYYDYTSDVEIIEKLSSS